MFNKKKHSFTKDELNTINLINNSMNKEIIEINKNISIILVDYSKSITDPKLKAITWGDYKTLYDNLHKLVIMKYIATMTGISIYYIQNDFRDYVNISDDYNPYDLNFNVRVMYTSTNICKIIDTARFESIMLRIDESITKIQVYNHHFAKIEIEKYIEKTKNRLSINDYNMLINQQIFNTIHIFNTTTEQIKNKYFNEIIFKEYQNNKELR